MNDLRLADRVTQLSPRIGEDRAHPHDRVIDRPRRRRDPEHLDNRLTDLIAREPEHPGEHRDVRIDTRPEPRQRTRRQARERRLLTRRAAQPQPRVLEHQRDDHRQLELLMAHRIADPLLAAIKLTSATAAIRQMPDPAIQPLGRDQLPGLALMPRLTARLPHRPLVCLPRRAPTLRPRRRRIRRRRQTAVTRIAVDLALKLLNPILKPTDHRQQRIYPLRMPRLYVLSQHACKIPCVTQEPCSAPRHPVSPYRLALVNFPVTAVTVTSVGWSLPLSLSVCLTLAIEKWPLAATEIVPTG